MTGFSELRVIGRGGFSVVYSALQIDLHRSVALKVIESSDESTNRLEREVRALGQLSDIPHIVPVHAVVRTAAGQSVLVMPLLARSLAQEIRQTGPQAPHVVCRWASQLAASLDQIHQRGVVHRDIKPENVLLDRAGDAFLVDFGIASLESLASRTATMMSISPPHSPPERLRGDESHPQSGDIYSLASTLYFALAGRAPYGTTSEGGAHGLMDRIASAPLPADSAISPPLLDVLSRAMSKDPADRFATAQQFSAALIMAASVSDGGDEDAGDITLPRAPRSRWLDDTPSAPTPAAERAEVVADTSGTNTSGAAVGGGAVDDGQTRFVSPVAKGALPGPRSDGDQTVLRSAAQGAPPKAKARAGAASPVRSVAGTTGTRDVEPVAVDENPAAGRPSPESARRGPAARVSQRSADLVVAPPSRRSRKIAVWSLLLLTVVVGAGALFATLNSESNDLVVRIVDRTTDENRLPEVLRLKVDGKPYSVSSGSGSSADVVVERAFAESETVLVTVEVPDSMKPVEFEVSRDDLLIDGNAAVRIALVDDQVTDGSSIVRRENRAKAQRKAEEAAAAEERRAKAEAERLKREEESRVFAEISSIWESTEAADESYQSLWADRDLVPYDESSAKFKTAVEPVFEQALARLDALRPADPDTQAAVAAVRACTAANLAAYERSSRFDQNLTEAQNEAEKDAAWAASEPICAAGYDKGFALQP